MLDQLAHLDLEIFQAINLGFSSPFLDLLMRVLTNNWTWIIVAIVLIGSCVVARRWNILWSCLIAGAAVGLTDFVTYRALKPTFQRLRPCHQSIEFRLVQDSCGSDFGFPSNHAANGAAIVAVLTWRHRRRGFLATAPIVVAVGLSRIYLGAHFPGDVAVGYVVGAGLGSGVAVTLRKLKLPFDQAKR